MARSGPSTNPSWTDLDNQPVGPTVEATRNRVRGTVATSDDEPEERTLETVGAGFAEKLASASIPPCALAKIQCGDRIVVNDCSETYTMQFAFDGVLSDRPQTIHLTRDRDGRRFALTTEVEPDEQTGQLTVAVQLARVERTRSGSIESSTPISTVGRLGRIGRGDPAYGPGRTAGVILPETRPTAFSSVEEAYDEGEILTCWRCEESTSGKLWRYLQSPLAVNEVVCPECGETQAEKVARSPSNC